MQPFTIFLSTNLKYIVQAVPNRMTSRLRYDAPAVLLTQPLFARRSMFPQQQPSPKLPPWQNTKAWEAQLLWPPWNSLSVVGWRIEFRPHRISDTKFPDCVGRWWTAPHHSVVWRTSYHKRYRRMLNWIAVEYSRMLWRIIPANPWLHPRDDDTPSVCHHRAPSGYHRTTRSSREGWPTRTILCTR